MIIQKQGDMYWVDCCITGSNDGTLSDPKCSMKRIFKEVIFIQIERLVAKGGEFENASVIIQGDQAGPHEDKVFRKFVDDYCNNKGWKWQPQAPQMPHANVLDLSFFSAMKRRHCNLIRISSGLKVVSSEAIWNCSKEVWDKLPNKKIAAAFIQYWRTLAKVIKSKGNNDFVGSGGSMYCDVSKDVMATKDGLIRINGKKIL